MLPLHRPLPLHTTAHPQPRQAGERREAEGHEKRHGQLRCQLLRRHQDDWLQPRQQLAACAAGVGVGFKGGLDGWMNECYERGWMCVCGVGGVGG